MDEPICVLHVDDEPAVVQLVDDALEAATDRIDVVQAPGVEAALDRLAGKDVDCIVADFEMPETDGLAFLEAVRADHPDLPFILFTGRGSEGVASEAISAGVTDYFQKRSGTSQFRLLANRIENAVERYRSRQAIDATERRLTELADSSEDVLYMVSGDWSELLFVNAAYEEIWGGTVEELEVDLRSFLDYVHPEDRDLALASMDRLAAGEPDTVEYRVVRPDGEVRWVHGHGKPIYDDGRVARIVGYVRDVTHRRRREERLEATVAQYEALFENSPDMILTHDREGRVLDANQRLADALGYRKAEVVGMDVWDLDETVEPTAARRFWAELPRDEVRQFEGQYRRRDDTTFPVEIHLVRLEIDGDDHFLAIAHDISVRKERQRNLERYRSLVNAMGDPVAIYDADGRYVVVNDHLAAGYGCAKEDLVGQRSTLVSKIRASAEGDPYRELLEGERDVLRGEYPSNLEGRDTMECRLTRLEIDGRYEGVVAVSRDVSERKARERELERANERLERFASGVSHDLRNPLAVAQGRLELAVEEATDEHLEEIRRAHERMGALINDLLLLARQGDDTTELAPVELRAMAESCWANVATDGAELVTEADRVIRADERRLRHLFENVIRNAVEHGGEDVTVWVGDRPAGFYVEDDGPGIPADRREAVFEHGYSTGGTGTGFGLSIAEEVASAHGWELAVVEGRSGGARFEVSGVAFVD